MVFNATIFHNISVISWRSVLLVEETGVHNVVSSTSRHERDFFFFIELELTDKFYMNNYTHFVIIKFWNIFIRVNCN